MNKSGRSQSEPWYKNLSVIRWIFAVFGILIMVFSGGCALFGLSVLFQKPSATLTWFFVSSLPFIVGMLIWLLAAKAGRKNRE